ncbi:MAG: hypothetical protein J6B88_02655 [Clostridia bacterium]|nr:hypothetical protein [Clostridia bacterium]
MADEKKIELAKQVYSTLCAAIEKRNWNFEKDEEKLVVFFGVSGEDIPMKFVLIVDAERQLVRLMSPLPFNMSEAKRLDGAIATCVATFGMADGNFDYDLATGEVMFRLTASFRNSVVGEGLFQYMISLSCAVVDKYNDQFLAIDKGVLDINDFIKNNS